MPEYDLKQLLLTELLAMDVYHRDLPGGGIGGEMKRGAIETPYFAAPIATPAIATSDPVVAG